MTKSEWMAIAQVIAAQRAAVVASWPPSDGYRINAAVVHDRKLIYLAQLEAFDKIAIVMAATLEGLCSKFDRHHFMRIVGKGS